MGADDWYRMTDWTEEGAANFEKKIERARSQKAQYLTLQAYHLLDRRPDISLKLLDRAEEADVERYEGGRINNFRAEANLRLGNIEKVLSSYEDSMREQRVPGAIVTSSALDYAFVVAYFRIADKYDVALDIVRNFPGSPFPNSAAQALGAHAMILSERGEAGAGDLARDALGALDLPNEPLDPEARYGSVSAVSFIERLREIAI